MENSKNTREKKTNTPAEQPQEPQKITLEELFEAIREFPVKTTEDLRLERFFYRISDGKQRAKVAIQLMESGEINGNELRYNRSYALMYEHAKSKGGIKWQ